jgi:hypothetical protein
MEQHVGSSGLRCKLLKAAKARNVFRALTFQLTVLRLHFVKRTEQVPWWGIEKSRMLKPARNSLAKVILYHSAIASMRLTDYHIPKSYVCLSTWNAASNADHQAKAY